VSMREVDASLQIPCSAVGCISISSVDLRTLASRILLDILILKTL
jgi:hypothetical protein